MRLLPWDQLPEDMRVEEVRPYYESLAAKQGALAAKRAFDVAGSLALIVLLSWLILGVAVAVKVDSPGPVFYRQVRVTQYGRKFRIFKFRSMVANADKIGAAVTTGGDPRITRVGAVIRKYRLDEIGQLFNVLTGDMSFVGTRPEVPRYVEQYTPEMRATLLLPAGVTSLTSIMYKDEGRLLDAAEDPDRTYVEEVLPGKMRYNLQGLLDFSLLGDLKLMLQTVAAVAGASSKRKSNAEMQVIADSPRESA
ncbi:MAG: sugar transferase [Eggerthellaceae bacterium]|nr:sugar transferase [Eggerthellaceae bacterium]